MPGVIKLVGYITALDEPEFVFGSLNQTGEPSHNGITERTESGAGRYLRLERMATGVT